MDPVDLMNRRDLLKALPAVALVAPLAATRRDQGAKPDVPPPADLSWWREARFGMFVHWGPVSLRGTEIGWSRGKEVPVEEYDALYRRFDPKAFDASAWAGLAKDAGMKYLVLTTKHHDGFCLWDSRLTDYDITGTPFRRDVVRELADACRRAGVVFCAYHSICDWRHPDYPLGSPGGETKKPSPNMERYMEYLKGQLAELLRGYGPLGLLWFDGDWEAPWDEQKGRDLYRFVRGLQPSVIVNNRVGKAREGLAGTSSAGAFAGDYDTPEQQVGRYRDDRPWESCITICEQWAWKPGDTLKPLAQCLETLVTCAGGDGNLLLNVGPMPNGEIEGRQAERLRQVGRWLGVHGESIYGTRGGPWRPQPWGVSTRKGPHAYLHVYRWPGEGPIVLPAIGPRAVSARVLGAAPAELRENGDGLTVSVAPGSREPIDTVVRIDFDGDIVGVPAR
jgi:alpha-L-fucosidase